MKMMSYFKKHFVTRVRNFVFTYQSNDLSHDLIFNMQNKNYGPCNQLFLKIAHYFVNKFGSHY